MTSPFITYEQPLNENIRLCLRLEHLFNQLQYHLKLYSSQSSRLALETLLKIVEVSDRLDLKTKIIQALNQQVSTLTQLEQSPHIDREKLQQVLHKLDCLIDALHKTGRNKIGEELRQDAFLKQVRLQSNNPAGACNFSIPAYTLWLHLSDDQRMADLLKWKKAFDLLENVVATILHLIRNSVFAQKVTANDSFYQQALNPSQTYQMVRVTIPVNMQVYPEISVGKHRLAIRFKPLSAETPTNEWQQTMRHELSFQLGCC